MMEGSLCPCCESGTLSLQNYTDTFLHRGERLVVEGLSAYICGECGERTTDSKLLRENNARVAAGKQALADAERERDHRLQGSQIKRVRELLGLTQAHAARVFGGGPNIFSKYERGEVVQSEPMDILLRMAEEVEDARSWLLARAGLSVPAEVAERYEWQREPVRAAVVPIYPKLREAAKPIPVDDCHEWQRVAAYGGM